MIVPAPYSTADHAPFYLNGGPNAALLIHGFPGTPAEMRRIGNVIHQHGWTVCSPLLPGFGADIGRLASFGASDWLGAVLTEAESLAKTFAHVVLVGNSMGAALVLEAANHVRVSGLALFSPFIRVAQPWLDYAFPLLQPFFRKIRPFDKADFTDVGFRSEIAHILPGADLDEPAVQAYIRALELPTSVLGELRRCGHKGLAAAAKVSQPVLILQGRSDPIAHPIMSRKLAAVLPNLVGYVELPGTHELVQQHDSIAGQSAYLLSRFLAHTVCAKDVQLHKTVL
jgi:carboxylesterase